MRYYIDEAGVWLCVFLCTPFIAVSYLLLLTPWLIVNVNAKIRRNPKINWMGFLESFMGGWS